MSFELKATYRQCIKAVGCVGATVAKFDNDAGVQVSFSLVFINKTPSASSTTVLLDGKQPGEFAPGLQSLSVKQKLICEEKSAAYPPRLGAAGMGCLNLFPRAAVISLTANQGVFQLFWEDIKKPISERYIQRLVTMPDGGLIILTCLAALMKWTTRALQASKPTRHSIASLGT